MPPPASAAERRDDGLRCARAKTRQRGNLVNGSLPDPPDGAEAPQQSLAPGRTEAGNLIELTFCQRLRSLRPVIGDGEPVRLVAYPLQQVQALAGARHDDRGIVAGQPDLLEPLGEAAHGDIVDAEFVERLLRRRRLGGPTVHDHEPGRVGEPALSGLLPPWLGGPIAEPCGLLRAAEARSGVRRPEVPARQRVKLAGLLPFFQVAPESPGDHLVNRGDVALSVAAGGR